MDYSITLLLHVLLPQQATKSTAFHAFANTMHILSSPVIPLFHVCSGFCISLTYMRLEALVGNSRYWVSHLLFLSACQFFFFFSAILSSCVCVVSLFFFFLFLLFLPACHFFTLTFRIFFFTFVWMCLSILVSSFLFFQVF